MPLPTPDSFDICMYIEVKKQDKCPPNQTKEEETGNLSDKEFPIKIVKMIQNLENKMELQINSLETRIEKMQEILNKDLEETKKSCKSHKGETRNCHY